MNTNQPKNLPMTSALLPFANGFDLTPFAQREQAYSDMLASARKFDGSYEEAKARFDAIEGKRV